MTEHDLLGDASTDALQGRRFSLLPVVPEYHRSLYRLCVADRNNFRWRYQGVIPSFEVFERQLHSSVLSQFVVVANSAPHQLAGLVVAYNSNLQSSYCFVGVIGARDAGAGILEGLALFLRFLIRQWPFRKIYFETPQYNVEQFQTAVTSGLLKEEGRLKGHVYFLDRYWDFITYAAYKDDLLAYAAELRSVFPKEVSMTDPEGSSNLVD